MKQLLDGRGLLLTAGYRSAETDCLVVTAGLLVDSVTGAVLPTVDSWEWITERFAGEPFDRGLKKAVGTFAVHGKAYALDEVQRQGMVVRAQLGSRQKALQVFPPRVWRHGVLGWNAVPNGVLGSVSLDFSHAFGGAGFADNPDGKGYNVDPDAYAQSPLAQIECAEFSVGAPEDRPPFASFLPLPPQSRMRTRFMGTLDEQWKLKRAPWLPLDTDPRWFNEVAQDQCSDRYWRGDESWLASGMHPQQAQVGGTLPGLRPRLFIERDDRALQIEEVVPDLDTVWLFPDAERLLLLYRVQVPLKDPDAEDILAIGLGCELRADPALAAQAWIDRLWPQPDQAQPHAEPEPLVEVDAKAMLATLQASADLIYAEVAATFQESLAVAAKLAKRTGQHFDPAAVQVPIRPDFAAMLANPKPGAMTPFDTVAHEAKIRAAVAQGEAEVRRHVETIAKRLKTTPEELYRQAAANTAAAAAQAPMQAARMVDRLPLPAAQKADLSARISAGVREANALEAEISSKVAQMRQAIAASAEMLPSPPALAAPLEWTRENVQAAYAAGESLVRQRFVGLDLSGLDLTQVDVRGSHFEHCQLLATKLNAAKMRHCVFIDCQLDGVQLQQVDFREGFIQRCCADKAQFDDASLSGLFAADSSFMQSQWPGTVLPGSQFMDCTLTGSQFGNAVLEGSRLLNCALDGMSAAQSRMANTQFENCLLDGLDICGADLSAASWSRTRGSEINASNAQLVGWRVDQQCQLPGIRLENSDLSKASLQGGNLRGASLREACLVDALLSRCDLRDSDGYRLDARRADFTGSDLSAASWKGANLMDARLRKVSLDATDLSDSNLFAASTDAARGDNVRLDRSLLAQCRLKEDLARV
jgi:uncharacterized protein YjbI with pentapeptide repeats